MIYVVICFDKLLSLQQSYEWSYQVYPHYLNS